LQKIVFIGPRGYKVIRISTRS